MFIDNVVIQVASGQGGNGAVAWRREKYVAYGGPAGGDGGLGGSVYLEASHNLQTLLDFRFQREYKAEDGKNGQTKNCHGKGGQDLVVYVPVGTVVRDGDTQQPIADLTHEGQRVLVAQGGRGGRGNARFATPKRKAPYYAEPGEDAVERSLRLELKLLADVGLIGLPNAGKSSLIRVLSAARPKVANYPFTTLTPQLGVMRKPDGDGLVIADIPGLIEGASLGVGLGHDFLRHIERCQLLVHLVDGTAADGGTPASNYQQIRHELAAYSPALAKYPQLVLLTKADALTDEQTEEALAELAAVASAEAVAEIMMISSITGHNIEAFKTLLLETLERIPKRDTTLLEPLVPDTKALATTQPKFEVIPHGIAPEGEAVFEVAGSRVTRWLSVVDMKEGQALRHLFDVLKAMGVIKALQGAGIQPGDTLMIGDQTFDYWPDATPEEEAAEIASTLDAQHWAMPWTDDDDFDDDEALPEDVTA